VSISLGFVSDSDDVPLGSSHLIVSVHLVSFLLAHSGFVSVSDSVSLHPIVVILEISLFVVFVISGSSAYISTSSESSRDVSDSSYIPSVVSLLLVKEWFVSSGLT